jgi:type I restriction enzyme M protein
MRLLSTEDLADHLWHAADILRSSTDASEYIEIISKMLLLKRASDQPGILRVPEGAQWSHIAARPGRELGNALDKALYQLENSNPDPLDGVSEGSDFSRRLDPPTLQSLVSYFSSISLDDDRFEFSDTIGCAYNQILHRFADRAGKTAGPFYTPESISDLMVRLVRPQEGQSVYDPFVGSAGMLIQAKHYVDEHGGRSTSLSLFGQEKNLSMAAIAKINLFLNEVSGGSILCGDTLEQPMHTLADGQLMLFDRVVTNPPFSVNYDRVRLSHRERMRYGWTPKQADLMNVQHVLSVLRPDGIGAAVTPYGVLFRGGAEAEIRRGILEDNRIEAVIGIGANVFYGTAIPACILILRGRNKTSATRRGNVLFINAERETASGRTENRLEPAHVEKIVHAFRDWSEIPGFSRIVSLHEIAQNDFNLNIRRYIDSISPAEVPLDVRATLFGGIPRREVMAAAPRFQDFGIDLTDLFQVRDSNYLDFPPEGYEIAADRIPELSAPHEYDFFKHYNSWWKKTETKISELVGTGHLLMIRPELINSFSADLQSQGMLDQYQLRGILASWWFDHHDDLKSLDLRGFTGLLEHWTATRRFPTMHAPNRSAREQVFATLEDDLRSRTERLIFWERQKLSDTYRSWGERYATSLVDLEEQRQAVKARLEIRIQELGYDWERLPVA